MGANRISSDDRLHGEPSPFRKLGATATASSAAVGHDAEFAIDDDPDTIWHTAWGDGQPNYPYWLVIDMKQPVELAGIAITPRQDIQNGRVDAYRIYVSDDGETWGGPVAKGALQDGKTDRKIQFKKPVTARYIKLQARKPVNHDHPWAALAGIRPILPEE